jgi:hypothetical protein
MNDQAFIQHFATVRDYLFALPLAKEDLAPLLSKDVVEQQKFLFMRLAYSFFPLYPELREEERTALSAASYLSAIAVYAIDNVLDLQISGKAIRPLYRRSHLYFMESQRILCTLFAHDAPFWITYYSRYEDHFRELQLSEGFQKLDEMKYREILKCKYALIHVTIDMMDHLTQHRHAEITSKLHAFLDTFTFGYNLQNEVKGLREDMETGVNNYVYWLIIERMLSLGYKVTNIPEDIEKFLYASGIAEEVLAESNKSYDQVCSMAAELGLPEFILIVSHRKAENEKRISMLESYFEKLEAESIANI